MVVMTESWNEQRLDDLNGRVEGLRTEMHAGFAQLRTEMREGEVRLRNEMQEGEVRLRNEMQEGFAQLRTEMREGDAQLRIEMKEGFDRIDAKFDALHRTMIQVGGGLIGTMILAAAALVATQL